MVDGLKTGQRKILYCCFKRNLKKDIKACRPAQHAPSFGPHSTCMPHGALHSSPSPEHGQSRMPC
jgi:DNA gyrase/topoisomerase IV subunit A